MQSRKASPKKKPSPQNSGTARARATAHFDSQLVFKPRPGLRPVILLLDVSGSMARQEGQEGPIDFVVDGLHQVREEILKDASTDWRTSLCVMTFYGKRTPSGVSLPEIKELKPFGPMEGWMPPNRGELPARGTSPIGSALLAAKKSLEIWNRKMDNQGFSKEKPFIFLLTDGMPSTDDEEEVKEAREWTQAEIRAGVLSLMTFFCCEPELQDSDVGKSCRSFLRSLFPEGAEYDCEPRVYDTGKANFKGLFKFISSSITARSYAAEN